MYLIAQVDEFGRQQPMRRCDLRSKMGFRQFWIMCAMGRLADNCRKLFKLNEQSRQKLNGRGASVNQRHQERMTRARRSSTRAVRKTTSQTRKQTAIAAVTKTVRLMGATTTRGGARRSQALRPKASKTMAAAMPKEAAVTGRRMTEMRSTSRHVTGPVPNQQILRLPFATVHSGRRHHDQRT